MQGFWAMSHRETQVWIAFHHSKARVHPLAFVVGLPSQNTIQVCASVGDVTAAVTL
jgi:hypothetical protein